MQTSIKNLLSPSIRFEIRQKRGQIKHFLGRMQFWRWQHSRIAFDENNPIQIHYLGRPENKAILMSLLGANISIGLTQHPSNCVVRVTEHPMSNAICIPYCLTTIVKLGRSVEEVMSTYSSRLRSSINAKRAKYRHLSIEEVNKVNDIEQNMLRPYATVRHGGSASQLAPEMVRKFSNKTHGRLDLLIQDDEEVGCHLSNPYTRKGKHYWHINRLGYPSSVFNDFKRWGEVNSINQHLVLEAAIENGYDYCDYGISLAKPGHGLIEWKRRRRGFLATHDNFDYFYVKLPKAGGAQFLWDCPLFGVESGKPTLHLGIPADKTEEEMLARYNEMGYGGLYKVYLDCVNPPSDQFVKSIRALYADQETQPVIVTNVVG